MTPEQLAEHRAMVKKHREQMMLNVPPTSEELQSVEEMIAQMEAQVESVQLVK